MTLKFAVLQGTGMCILPDSMCADDVKCGRLVDVLKGWASPPGVVHAVCPSRRGLVPAVRRLLDFLGDMPGALVASSPGLSTPAAPA